MANIEIRCFETHKRYMPRICMKCGADTDGVVLKEFAWPSWRVGLPLWLLSLMTGRNTMTVHVPLCDDHRNLWRDRNIVLIMGLAVSLVLTRILFVTLDRGFAPRGAFIDIIISSPFVIWVLVSGAWLEKSIRPVKITDQSITLCNVAPEFVEEWEILLDERREQLLQENKPGNEFDFEDM